VKKEYSYGIYEGMEDKTTHMNCGIGRHTLFENNMAIIFEGSWMDNKFHGYGRRILNQGDYWMSQLKMGKYHGHHI
jgi:hypothetical protein